MEKSDWHEIVEIYQIKLYNIIKNITNYKKMKNCTKYIGEKEDIWKREMLEKY